MLCGHLLSSCGVARLTDILGGLFSICANGTLTFTHLKADYMEVEGELEFGPGEVSKDIEIEIIDDDQYERDENFFVELFDVTFEAEIAELERLGSGKGGAVVRVWVVFSKYIL